METIKNPPDQKPADKEQLTNLFGKKICDHLFSASSNTPEKANRV